MANKKSIMVIKAGGTICEKPNGKSKLDVPDNQNYLHLVPEIFNIANITEKEISPIDSTNMSLQHRKKFARIIQDNQNNYDGFVIIQGTDSMAASAITLNYMVQDLGKPIVFTGSQKPIYEKKTDAKENVLDAIKVATKNIGESVIVFNKRIIRGSRAIKRHSTSYFGFYSPKARLVGRIKDGEVQLKDAITRRLSLTSKVFTNFKKNIFYFTQISGADTNLLEKIVKDIDCEGIIIGGYGTGNINSKYIKAIDLAIKKGKPVAITTKCPLGKTKRIYEAGEDALKAGAFLTYDMTREAAFHKMMYSLGMAKSERISRKNTPEFVKEIFYTPIGRDITIR